jgi:hypothetical protein
MYKPKDEDHLVFGAARAGTPESHTDSFTKARQEQIVAAVKQAWGDNGGRSNSSH